MTALEVLSQLSDLNVTLWVEGERLRYRAPQGVMTAGLRDGLATHKTEIIRILRQLTAANSGLSEPLRPIDRSGELPLSFSQQRLWFLHQWQPDNAAYIIADAIRMSGRLDLAALEMSLGEVVRRHESLRTIFRANDQGQPVQVILPAATLCLRVVDLQMLPEAGRQAELAQAIATEARRPFDLEQGPLLRVTLFQLMETEYALLVVMHHIISDGWSTGVLIREMVALYQDFKAGRSPSLLPLPIQYVDFAAWQREQLQGAALDTHIAYWTRQLAGAPDALDLPADRLRPAAQTFRGDTVSLLVPGTLSVALHTLSRHEGVTLFTTLLTAFSVLLARYTGQDDILIGSPIANRDRAEIEGLIGFFVNTLVFRTNLSGAPVFRELLQRVRETALDAYTHQAVPFEKLVEVLKPTRDPSRTPLFQVTFAIQEDPLPALDLPGLSIGRLEIPASTAKFDLLLFVEERAGDLMVWIEYNCDLFDRSRIERMIRHYRVLLEGIVAGPQRRVHELPLLTAPERDQILTSWNATAAAFPPAACVHLLVDAQARRVPEAIAMIAPAGADPAQLQTLTYGELRRRANQVAHFLRARGVGPEVPVGIYMHRSIDMLVAMLGVLKAGGAYVPLDPAYPAARLAFMLEDAQMPVLLTQERLASSLPPYQGELICLDASWTTIAQEPTGDPAGGVIPDNLAYIIYTSGSTGIPNGVQISHANLCNLIAWHVRAFAVTEADRATQLAGVAFDASVWEVWPYLTTGASLSMPDELTRTDPSALRDWLLRQAITISFVPTPLTERLLELAWPAGARLRMLLTGGDYLHHAPPAGMPFALVNNYGPTENTVVATSGAITPEDRAGGAPGIGGPIANTQIYLLDRSLQPVPIGVPGEIYLGGLGLGRGYLRRPELTAERFVPNPFTTTDDRRPTTDDRRPTTENQELTTNYRRPKTENQPSWFENQGLKIEDSSVDASEKRSSILHPPSSSEVGGQWSVVGGRLYKTGDLARWRPDGTIEFLGRLDHQVKIRGFRIELGEIEAAVRLHPAVRNTVVLTRNAGTSAPQLVAYVVLQEGQSLAFSGLREFLRQRLPEYMLPTGLVLLEELPLTPNGKIDRQRLPVPEDQRPEAGNTFVAPRTDVEETLALLWMKVLDISRVGVFDNFFDLGGHSLLTIQLISQIRDAFHVELPVRSLFEAPTIAGLSRQIQAARREGSHTAAQSIVAVPRNGPLPPSFTQQRLWLIDQLVPGNAAYNTYRAARIRGPLDRTVAGRVLNEILRRHEILRTSYTVVDGQPAQVIAPPHCVTLPVIDLRVLPPAEREATAIQLANEAFRAPYDLHNGPIWHATLVWLADDDYGFILCMHHIAYDEWSGWVLLKEIESLYPAYAAGRPSPLPELPVQYADYAVWQRQWFQEHAFEKQMAYWRQQLAGATTRLELPADHPRPAVQTFRGERPSFDIALDTTDGLRRLSREAGTTLFMTTFAAFVTLLYRYTGQPDVLVGTPISGRNQAELEDLIGFFTNTIVLRARLADNPTFRELLGQVREVALEAMTNQDLSFDMLVNELQPERDSSYHPLFQVMFVFIANYLALTREVAGLAVSPLSPTIHSGTSQFDLTLTLAEVPSGLRGWVYYNVDLFDATTIERLGNHFRRLLEAAVAVPDCRIGDLAILPDEERRKLVYEWNATRVPYPQERCLHGLFLDQVAATPHALALSFDDTSLTYAQLAARAGQLAHYLQQHGVGPDSRVGVAIERSLDLVVALCATLLAGAAYLPLDPSYPKERLAFMLHDAQPAVVLTQHALCGHLPPHSAPTLCLDSQWDALVAAFPTSPPASAAGPDHLAYIIYTSGSTGTPKGAMNSHRAIVNRLLWMQDTYRLSSADRVLQKTPFSFDVSVWEFFWPLICGARLVVAPPGAHQDSAALVRLIREQAITTLHFVPAMLQVFVEEEGLADCTSLRRVICSGEALPYHLQQRFFARCASELHNLYGPTEAAVDVSAWACRRAGGQAVVPIGYPIANIQLYILDTRLQPVPIGVAGELYIGGVGLARGYWQRPELTAERFIPNPFTTTDDRRPTTDSRDKVTDFTCSPVYPFTVPAESAVSGQWSVVGGRLYKTGDLCRYRPDGSIEYLGRLDFQVKLRGFRIELGEVEAAIRQHPVVREAVVVAREDTPGDRQLVAYIVPSQEPQSEDRGWKIEDGISDGSGQLSSILHPPSSLPGELREFLQQRLPEYMAPTALVLLEALPLSPNGKIDRRALPAPDRSQQTAGRALALPRTPLEEILATQWAAILNQERVGIHDNFFTLGGHSLLAMQLVARVRQILGREIPLRLLFEASTVAELAARLERESRGAHLPPLHPRQLPADAPLPLSFAQERLWFIDQLQPGSPAYNILTALQVHGSLDPAALRQSLNALVARHTTLRTTFALDAGKPVQVIAPPGEVPLRLIDLRDIVPTEQDAVVQRQIASEVMHAFDLAAGPLLRVTLLQLGEQAGVLLLNLHHIIVDGWSMGVLLRDLTAFYHAALGRQAPDLPPLSLTYADYALWQREWLRGAALEHQLSYWRSQLDGAPGTLALPADFPRPAVQTFQGATYDFTLAPALVQALAQLSRAHGSTLFMTLLAAFQVLLARISGQWDIVLGAPIAGRTHAETEDLVGCFINTLVLRTQLDAHATFAAVLEQVREMCLGAYAHQDLPFEQLVEALHPDRDLSRQPVIQVLFGFQNALMPDVMMGDLTLELLPIAGATARYDLTINLVETAQGLRGMVEYARDLFTQDTIARLIRYFTTLLEDAAALPERRIGELRLLTAAERRQLLVDWNATWTGYPRDLGIHSLFEAQAERSPEDIALVFGPQSLTYGELNRRANQLAHYLQARGVGPEVCVGICMERSAGLIVGLLGILKAGGAYVPLDPAQPAERLQYMLEDSRASVLLTHKEIRDWRLEISGSDQSLISNLQSPTVIDLDAEWERIAQEPETNPAGGAVGDNLAYVMYTSGSTGRPKGIAITHSAIGRLVLNTDYVRLEPDDRVAQAANASFDAATFEIWGPLLHGARVIGLTRDIALSPHDFAAQISRHRVSTLFLTTALFNQLAAATPECFSSLRHLLFGGEAVDPRWVDVVLKEGAPARLLHVYGPTECTTFASWYAVRQVPEGATTIPIGRPIANTRLYVLDRHLEPVPVGVPGELYIGGDGLARGYLDRPELTAERFIPNPFAKIEDRRLKIEDSSADISRQLSSILYPLSSGGERLYKTGDLVRYQPDGAIVFLGRADQQVKLRGFRIELGEIEAVLLRHAAVREAVVMVREDVPGDRRLVAYLTMTTDHPQPTTEDRGLKIEDSFADASRELSSILHPPSSTESVVSGPSSVVGELRAFLQERLPDYMVPSAFVLLDALPLTANGKVDRRKLPAPATARPELERPFVGPRTPVEEQLAAIWRDLLNVDQIGVDDNFFELGGHSLLATQIVARLRQILQVDVPLRSLFAAPTVAELAEEIVALRKTVLHGTVPPLQTVERTARMPLSFVQERLWFLDRLEPGSPFYNIPAAVRLRGHLDLAALQHSLNALIARHEVLRTTFAVVDGQPVQVIAPALALSLKLEELGECPAAERDRLALQLATAEARRPFDLAGGPLIRATLLHLAEAEYLALVTLHHSIADGWSIGVFVRELGAFYTAFVNNQPATLPELPIQYADFAIWQRRWLQGDVLERQLAYWRQQLGRPGDQPLHLELPADRPRPAVQTFHGAHYRFALPAALADALNTLSRREGVTLFMTLLAAFQVLLHRYSGQDDIAVGTPIAGRTRIELEPLIGCFINTLVLRTDLSGAPSFRALLRKVQQITLAAYDHQEVPFEVVVEAVQPERQLSYSPLFQVLFVMQNTPALSLELPGVQLSLMHVETSVVKYDLVLSVDPRSDRLGGFIAYNMDLFEAATIERMFEHFQVLLAGILDDPDQSIDLLPILGKAERQQVLYTWNATRRTYPLDCCLHALIEEQVEHTPEAVALVFETGRLSYQELNGRANQLARYLRRRGVGPDTLVGICVERSLEMVIGLLGILKAGGAYVPLDPAYPAERLAYMLEDSQVPVLLIATTHDRRPTTDDRQPTTEDRGLKIEDSISRSTGELSSILHPLFPSESVVSGQWSVVDLVGDWEQIARESAENPDSGATGQSAAYAIYTSGSTGQPKGAIIPHQGIVNRLLWMQETYRLTSHDRVLQKTPFSFDVSVWEFFWPLLSGAALVVARPEGHKDSTYLVEVIRREQITTLHFVPPMLQVFLEHPHTPTCASIRQVICSGEALPYDLQERFFARLGHAALHNLYGPTEAAVDVTYWPCSSGDTRRSVPIGFPVANTQMYVLDRHAQPVPIGVPGELHIGGVQLARGYLNRPELTAERFIPNPFERLEIRDWRLSDAESPISNLQSLISQGTRLYKTGDLARYRADGAIEYLGRIDHQVKLRGFRIELGEIEATLGQHPAVREAVVVAREDTPGDRRLVAYLTLTIDHRQPTTEDRGLKIEASFADASRELSSILHPPSSTESVVGGQSSVVGELRAFLQDRLPDYMIPASFVVLDALPLSPNGKMNRRALPAPEEPAAAVVTDFVAPGNAVEQLLAGMWAESFKLDRVGIHQSFFELGGNSIQGAVFINRLQELLGEYIYVVALFDAPTIAELARYLVKHYAPALARLGISVEDERAAGRQAGQEARVDAAAIASMRRLIPALPPYQLGPARNPPAIFLLSPPRSGSTLLRVMLAGHPALFAPPELELLPFNTLGERKAAFTGRYSFSLEGLIRGVMELSGSDVARARQLVEEYERQDLSVHDFYRVLQTWVGDRLLIDKTPSYALDAAVLRRAEAYFENARYIHLVRHPYGMINSFVKAKFDQVFFRYPHPFSLQTLAELIWTVSQQNILAFLAEVPQERQHRVSFEDLVRRPPEVMRDVCQFLGIAFDPAVLDPYQGQRMTDGPHTVSRMHGDVKFHTHSAIDPRAAEEWRQEYSEDILGEPTWELAGLLGYKRQTTSHTPVPSPAYGELGELRPVARGDDPQLPLSFAQQRLWFLDQLEPGSSFYNIPVAVRLHGQLDLAALRQSFDTLVSRHEVLRTTFAMVDGQPIQVIARPAPFALSVVDLRTYPAPERADIARRQTSAEAQQPFDLARGPLMRATLLLIDQTESLVSCTLHHIIADGWSLGVLIHELVTLYQAFSSAASISLPDLPIQYADFAVWQRQWLRGKVLDAQLTYWKQQLGDDPPVLDLPADRPRPAVQTFRGATEPVVVSPSLSAALNSLSQAEGVTLFMTLLAAFQLLLYRYTGQDGFLVGTPSANRNRKEIEQLIGFFVNTLVLRANLAGNPSFREALQRIRAVCLGAYAHQDLPFEFLVEALQPRRDLSYTPLFQVMFILQNAPMAPLQLPGLTWEPQEVASATAKFDLTLALSEQAAGLVGTIEYNTDLFDSTTIRRMAGHFETLLEAVVAAPERPIGNFGLLTAPERQQVLYDWNATGAPLPPVCLHQLVAAQVGRSPGAPALVCGQAQLSYAQLFAQANQLAHYLQQAGAGPERLVALCLPRSPQLIVALLATLQAGAAYLPLDPAHPKQRLARILADAQPALLLTNTEIGDWRLEIAGSAQSPTPVYLDTLEAELAAQPTHPPLSAVQPEHLCYLLYTSGSTGAPKGVSLTHRNAVALVSWACEHFQPHDLAYTLAATALTFDISVFELFAPLCSGGCVVLVDNALALLEQPSPLPLTLLNTVPSAARQLLQAGALPASLRVVNLAGEALPRALADALLRERPQVRLYNLYGPTEDSTYSTVARVPAGESGSVSIGRPLTNRQAYVLDRQMQPVPIGAAGELYLGGCGLARGYLGRPDLTAERFIPNPFATTTDDRRPTTDDREQRTKNREQMSETDSPAHPLTRSPAQVGGQWSVVGGRLYKTGDLARYRADGRLEFLGRLDHQIKLRGFRIELGEVEATLREVEQVRDAVVVAQGGAEEQRLVAYVVGVDGAAVSADELRQRLRARLPEYMVPGTYVFMEALPLNPNGKVDRRALPAPDEVMSGGRRPFVAPRTTLEWQLAQIWEDLLQVHPVSVTDNFFDLGGHSLLAVRLISRIQQTLSRKLPVITLFQGATIEQLARILQQHEQATAWSPLVALQERGASLPFFCVHPIAGSQLCYLPLARHLGAGQPCYGLQPWGNDGELRIEPSVEAMAACYIDALRQVQPHGPYLLGGWSIGSIIALEMARQLQQQGEEIALLAVLDYSLATYLGQQQPVTIDSADIIVDLVQNLNRHYHTEFAIPADQLRQLPEDARLPYVFELVKKSRALPPDLGMEQIHQLLQLSQFERRIAESYKPQPFDGPAILFRAGAAGARDPDRSLGWEALITRPLAIYDVPGSHFTMVAEPHVQVLAQHLQACIAEALPFRERGI